MTITLDQQYFAVADDNLLGYRGETNARTIHFVGLDNAAADTYSVVFSYDDAVTYESMLLDDTLTLTSAIMRKAGKVDVQVYACNVSGDEYTVVKKSNILELEIKPSLDDNAPPVPSIADCLRLLTSLEQLAASLGNITDTIITEQTDISADHSSIQQMHNALTNRFNECMLAISSAASEVSSMVSQISASVSQIYLNKTSIGMSKKNMLKIGASDKRINGVAMTVGDDGAVTLNGTSNDEFTSFYLSSDEPFDFKKHIPNGSYILCSNSIPGLAVIVTGYKYVNGELVNRTLAYCDDATPVSFTVNDDYDYNYVELYIDPQISFTQKKVHAMIRDSRITDPDWEAFRPSLQEQIDELRDLISGSSAYNEVRTESFTDNVQEVTT